MDASRPAGALGAKVTFFHVLPLECEGLERPQLIVLLRAQCRRRIDAGCAPCRPADGEGRHGGNERHDARNGEPIDRRHAVQQTLQHPRNRDCAAQPERRAQAMNRTPL